MKLLKIIVSTALCAAMILPAAAREIPVCAEEKKYGYYHRRFKSRTC